MPQKIPKRYVPKSLSSKDRKTQLKAIRETRKKYKQGIYVNRPILKTAKKVKSSHVKNATRLYGVKTMKPTQELAEKTGCSIKGLQEILKKGRGAYYSSGSRPNQTADSWAYARLASAITGANASKVDYHILKKYCEPHSMALRLAQTP